MAKLKEGLEILQHAGGITEHDGAIQIIKSVSSKEQFAKINRIKNEEALLKIANTIALCKPDSLFINTGSREDENSIRRISIEKGEEEPLPLKDHTVHFDLPQEQGRIIDRTFYIINEEEKTSSLAQTVLRNDAYDYVKKHMDGIMQGKKMLVGFFSRGPIGAQAAVPAIEITSSTYVMHSANLLYRTVFDQFDAEVHRVGYFFTNVHSEGPHRPEDLPHARVFMDRSWLTTFSMFCTYAGNTLLLKKGNHRFAVDIATYHKRGKELSEHMFITGIKGPNNRTTYIAGAAPSGCGKTTTAMAGTDFIGDDLAQLWIGSDGTLRGINPEKGIFGIVEDVNRVGDPHLMEALREEKTEVIWSNVLIDNNGIPRWTGDGEPPPAEGRNFQGEWWQGKKDDKGHEIPISHPNARCTLQNIGIDNYNREMGEDPKGIPIRIITYSGRDSDTMPPVWVAKNAAHGVVLGASLVSAATATELGAQGVRRQPWANEPFIPGGLCDYMQAQFAFFNSSLFKTESRPIIAGLNYFLTEGARGGEGSVLLGEKRDVIVWLSWLERMVHGEVGTIETPIGFLPIYSDLETLFREAITKVYPVELYENQFSLYIDNIIGRIEMQKKAYGREADTPPTLYSVYDQQLAGLKGLKEKHGSIVSPFDLNNTER